MTYADPLAKREKALEEAFFREESERLLERIRARRDRATQREGLAEVLGTHEKPLLELLLDLGLRAENVAALVLAPLVSVAWADHTTVESEERRSIRHAEEDHGIDPHSQAGELLELWLDHRPHESLLGAWATYVHLLCKQLTAEEREHLRADIVGRSRRIARSLEKSLLRGSGPSEAERAVLRRIEAAFEPDAKGIDTDESDKPPAGPRSSLDDIVLSAT